MQDNDRRFADDPGRAIERRRAAPTPAKQDSFLGEDSALLRGLLADMTFAGAPGRR